ncbi:glycosyltransferase, partial [Vibrio sp. FNV 38]|nr:glycosyltransferase [Vibrio sp. FNV 38]
MSVTPRISVIITSYERGRLLHRAVESVLAQTYMNVEVIIVDDNSKDEETLATLSKLSQLEHITVLVNHCNMGANFSRNRGIMAATGIFYTGLDDDDYFLPDRCQILFDSYKEEYSFICDNYKIDNGKKIKQRFLGSKVLGVNDLLYVNSAGNQVFTSIEKIKLCGLFDEDLKRLQDQDMWLRLICYFGKAKRINRATYIMDTSHEELRIT